MKKRKIALEILLALALGTGGVFADEIPSYDMEEIVITADAYRAPVKEDTMNVKVISPGRAATIPELLQQCAGIDIQKRSFAGDNQDGTVKLRGFDARRYTVLLNGRQINSAGVMGGSYIDWNTIPLNTVEKIQIIKGGKLASQGNTLGGTINIITNDKGSDGGEISIVSGQNGQYGYLFNYAGKADKLHFNVTGSKRGANAYLKNNDYDEDQYGIRLNYEANSKDSFAFGVNKTEERRGFIVANKPGTAGYDPKFPIADGEQLSPNNYNPYPGSYWKKQNTYYDFNYRHLQKYGYWQFDYYKNDEQRREVNYNSSGTVVLDRTIPSDKSDYFGLSGKQTIKGNTYGYGVDYKRLRYGYGYQDINTVGDSAIYPSQKVDLFGFYIDDTWTLDRRWNAYFGIRYDSFTGKRDSDLALGMRELDNSSISPKLNLSFKNNRDTTTYISVNRIWRAPSMAEYYWWSKNYNMIANWNGAANPSYHQDIKPEKGMNYELGTEHRFNDRYTSKITFYYQDISDYLNFQHAYPFFCYNINQVNVWGAEWENSFTLSKVSKAFLNYTNQHTKKAGVAASDLMGLSNELDYQPRHKIALSYLYDAKPWQVRYTANYVSSQLDGMYQKGAVMHIGGYTVHNIAVTRNLDAKREVTLYVDNLFDKSYAEQAGYPMVGRLVSMVYTSKF
ncbi:MAG: TonB-dependent receptor [Pelosinus sp.]|nr:TonB-dependent receptor [Pelosinus sp.]